VQQVFLKTFLKIFHKLVHWGKIVFVKNVVVFKIIFNRYIKTRTTVVISVFTLFSVFYVSYFLDLVFTTPVTANIGGYQYTLFVSNTIKDFPSFKPLENSKRFSYQLGQNGTGIRDSLSFDSHASISEIISFYQVYFDIIRARPVLEGQWSDSFIMYGSDSQVIYVIVSDVDSARRVVIERYIVKE